MYNLGYKKERLLFLVNPLIIIFKNNVISFW